jgi:hypothetical protein
VLAERHAPGPVDGPVDLNRITVLDRRQRCRPGRDRALRDQGGQIGYRQV